MCSFAAGKKERGYEKKNCSSACVDGDDGLGSDGGAGEDTEVGLCVCGDEHGDGDFVLGSKEHGRMGRKKGKDG